MALCEIQPSGREPDGWIVLLVVKKNEFSCASLNRLVSQTIMTADQLLEIALRSDSDECERLQELCADRATAGRLARALEHAASQQSEQAKSWASVLEESTPD